MNTLHWDEDEFMAAAVAGKVSIVRDLLDTLHAKDLIWRAFFASKGLVAAAENGQTEVVRLLLLQQNIREHQEALIVAAQNGHLEVIIHLLRQDKDFTGCGLGALRWAIQNKHAEVEALLLSRPDILIDHLSDEAIKNAYSTLTNMYTRSSPS